MSYSMAAIVAMMLVLGVFFSCVVAILIFKTLMVFARVLLVQAGYSLHRPG